MRAPTLMHRSRFREGQTSLLVRRPVGVSKRGRWYAPLLLLSAIVLAPVACADRRCWFALQVCESRVTGTLDVALKPAELDGKRLEICRNGTCVTAKMFVSREEIGCAPTAADPAGAAGCESALEVTSSGVRIHVIYYPGSSNDLTNGDRFTLRILDATAFTTFAERAAVASYSTTHTEGNDCEEARSCTSGTLSP